MEGYTAWYKYQSEATIHLLRWNAEFTEKVWTALSSCLQPYQNDGSGKPRDLISAALVLRRQNPTSLADLADLFNITEKQLWALLITQANPDTTSLDRLSDARDQIHQITAQENFEQQRRLHANYNYGFAERRRQSSRAKTPRNKIDDGEDGTTIRQIISTLATQHQYSEFTAKELWPIFLSELDRLHFFPMEHQNFPKWEDRRCVYDFRDEKKTITFRHFANTLSKFR